MSSTAIVAASYYVPNQKLTHAELARRFGEEPVRKIAESSGICERRVAASDECASDLAFRAATDLLAAFAVDPRTIDLVIFATQTPDYLLPTTACLLQNRLNIPTTCGAFDINLGCSQYVYSLAVAHGLIRAGLVKRALVMTGDTVSRIIHPQDRRVVPLFGDGATAALLERVPDGEGFQEFAFGTDGSGFQHLVWPTSGLRVPRTSESGKEKADRSGSIRRDDDMFMDGAAVFVFTLKTIPRLVNQLLEKARLDLEEIDMFIFHQASEMIVESSARKLGIPREKLHYKLHDVGNSGGSTVGIALTDAWLKGRIKPGMKILMAAFGVGLSWAGTIIRWPDRTLGAVCKVDYSSSPLKPNSQVTHSG
ncbi:MAG: ketoacyl-ACP synthase III [Verrucomicrobia bacterium]|nr:ketoacyl-ACP synthase III [Verrucomicrobiota bacterium]